MFSLLLFPGDVRIASMARGRSMSSGNLGRLIARLQRGHLRAGRSRQRVYLSSSCCMDFLMVLRTARRGRVNQPRVERCIGHSRLPTGHSCCFCQQSEVSAVFVSGVQNSEVGQRGLGVFKGEAGWGSSAPHKQTRSYFIPAAYILIINRFSPTIGTRSTAVYPGTVSIRHNTTIIAIIA